MTHLENNENILSDQSISFLFFFSAKGTKRGNEFPCPAGTYNNKTGLERVEDCVPCTTGHYCPQGTSVPKQCPRGTFNDVLGAKVNTKKYIYFKVVFLSFQSKLNSFGLGGAVNGLTAAFSGAILY